MSFQKTIHVVAAVLRNDDYEVLVQQRPPGKHMAGYWEFPGGKVEANETSWQALVRELREELNVAALEGAHLISLDHEYPDRHIKLEVWHLSQWRGPLAAQEKQIIEWRSLQKLAISEDLLPADDPIVTAILSR